MNIIIEYSHFADNNELFEEDSAEGNLIEGKFNTPIDNQEVA